MSRIGRLPITIPAGVTVTNDNNTITVKGPLGSLTKTFDQRINVEVKDGHIHVTRPNDTKTVKALHGLTRVLLNNMVIGVTQGFTKELVINGVSYKAVQNGANGVTLSVGYSNDKVFKAPAGITITVTSPTELTVKGIDKEVVGQVAADIKAIRVPDPYHLYGIRYKNEVLVKKEGKTAGK